MSFVDSVFGFIKDVSRYLLQLLQLLSPFLIFVLLIFDVPEITGFILVGLVLFSVFINFSFSNLDSSGLFVAFVLFLDFVLVLHTLKSYLVELIIPLVSFLLIIYILMYKRIYSGREEGRESATSERREREPPEVRREIVELRGLELREKSLGLFYLAIFLIGVYFFVTLLAIGVQFEVILFGGSFVAFLIYFRIREYSVLKKLIYWFIIFVLVVFFGSFVLFFVFDFSLFLKYPVFEFLVFLASLYRFSLGLFVLFVGALFYGLVLYLDDKRLLFEGADVSSFLFMLFYFHWLFWVLTLVDFFAFVGLLFLFLGFLGFLASLRIGLRRLFVFEVFSELHDFWNLLGLWLFFVFSYLLFELFFVGFNLLIYLSIIFVVVFVLFLGLARSYNVGVSWFKRLFGVASEANTIYDRREKEARSFRVVILAVLVAFSLVLFALMVWAPWWRASWLVDLSSSLGSVFFDIFLVYLGLSVFLCISLSYFYIFPYSVTDVFIFGEDEVSDSFGLRFYKYLGMFSDSPYATFRGYGSDKLDELLARQVDSPDEEFIVKGVSAWGVPVSLIVFSILSVFVWFLHVVFFVLGDAGTGGLFGLWGVNGAVVVLGFFILVSVLYLPWEFYRSEDLSELLFKSSFLTLVVGASYAFLILYWGFVLNWFVKGFLQILVYGTIGSLSSVFLLVDLPARSRLESLKSDELRPYVERLESLMKMMARGEHVDFSEVSYISALISSIEGKYKVSVTPAERILASILAGGLIAFFSFLH